MATSTPTITAEMRAAALEKAKETRHARAQFKQALASGEKTLEDAFALREDEVVGRIKVIDLLQTIPGVGEKRAVAIMEQVQIAPSRRVRGLSKRQMDELLVVEKAYRG